MDHFPDRAELVERARALYDARPDVQQAMPEPDSMAYWGWVNVSGYLTDAPLREVLRPIPPDSLTSHVSIGGLASFLEAGRAAYTILAAALEASGRSPLNVDRILDFGCGCGRTLRFLEPYAARVEIHGCDVDEAAIEWCRANLPFATVRTNPPTGRLPYADATFDVVYAISVFTHLCEENHLAWLDELHRVLRPDGIAILTTSGDFALEKLVQCEETRDSVGVPIEEAQRCRLALRDHGFAFVSQELDPFDHISSELYGMSFVSADFVRRHWCDRGFRLSAFAPGGLQAWQDVALLSRI